MPAHRQRVAIRIVFLMKIMCVSSSVRKESPPMEMTTGGIDYCVL
jgi:hypothetical protein